MKKVLLIGPAGSGKTLKIIEKFIECTKNKSKVFLLVPNASQVNHLKNILLLENHLTGFFDSSIITFSNLFYLFQIPKKKVISYEKKSLLLKYIFENNSFQSFEKIKNYDGFLRKFSNFIKILKENLIFNRTTLEEYSIMNTIGYTEDKTEDLIKAFLIYQEYLDKYNFIDYEDLLLEYLKLLENSKSLDKDLTLLVDGFNDFTELEFKILTGLFENAGETYITLPLVIEKNKYRSFFQSSKTTYEKLEKHSFETILLEKKYRTAKYCLNTVEENVFSCKNVKKQIEMNDDSVSIIKALNINDEIDIIGRNIIKYIKTGNYRYNDFVLIARDVDKYKRYVEKSFHDLKIPFRIYSNRFDYSGEAFNYLFSVFDIFIEGWKDRLILDVIKSGFLIPDRNSIWKIEEEYLLQGEFNTENKWFNFAEKIEIPGLVESLKLIRELESEVEKKHISGFIKITEKLVKNILSKTFQNNKSPIMTAENALQDKDFSENMNVLTHVLEELKFLERLYSGGKMEFSEFYKIFRQILTGTKSLKMDRRDNVVNIIDALEARQWEIPIVFVIGLIEKSFPRYESENILFRNSGFGNFSNSEEKSANLEKYLFYISVTRAKQKLFLSYPIYDSTYNNTLPSVYLKEILKVLPENQSAYIKRDFSNILSDKNLMVSMDDIIKYLSFNLNEYYQKDVEDNKNTMLPIKLYNLTLINSKEKIKRLKENFYNSKYIIPEKIESGRILKKIRSELKKISASNFNMLVQCKYKFYGNHILNLKNLSDKIERGLDNKIQGIIAHSILKNVKNDFEIEKLKNIFEDEFNKHFKKEKLSINEEKAKNNLYEYLKNFIEDEIKIYNEIQYGPVGFEWEFGKNESDRLKFDIPGYGEIYFTGRADRLDICKKSNSAFIIDYKFKDNFFDKAKQEQTYSGKDIQLFIYMLAAEKYLKLNVEGCAYYSIKSNNRKGIKFNEDFNLIKDIKLEYIGRKKWYDRCIETLNSYIRDISNGFIIARPEDKNLCGIGKCDFYPLCRIQKWKLED